MKTSQLKGKALCYAVDIAYGATFHPAKNGETHHMRYPGRHGGPATYSIYPHNYLPRYWTTIQRENKISVVCHDDKWRATNGNCVTEEAYSFAPFVHTGMRWKVKEGYGDENGDTPEEAVLRCFVRMKLGDEVEVPEVYL